jgi:outer membrane protein TolC
LLLPGPVRAAEPVTWALDDAIGYGLAHSPDLAEREAAVAVAQEAQGEVFANFLPKLTLTGGYEYIGNVPKISLSITPPLPAFIPPVNISKSIEMGANNNWMVAANLNQLVFASGRVYYGYRAAGEQITEKSLEVEAARLKVAQQTAEAFLGLLMAQEVFDAQSASLRDATDHLKDVQTRYDAGAASRFDLLRAEVEVDTIEPQVSQAAEQIKLAVGYVQRASGLSKDTPVKPLGKLEAAEINPLDWAAAHDAAQRQRPELAAFAAGQRAFEDAAKSRRAEMLPAVALTGSYGWQKPYYFDLDGDTNWTVGVGVQIPLFDGLAAYRGMSGDRANAEGLRRSAVRMRADIRTEVEAALLAADEAAQRTKSTKATLDRAEKLVSIAENSYKAGALTSLDVIDAQLAATRARVAYLNALYDYRVARVRLAAAAGDLQKIGR